MCVCVCVFMHARMFCVYICFLCVFSDIRTRLQFSSGGFHSSTVGVVQVTELSIGDPVYFSWLGCASVLKLCWASVATVWMCSLQHWQTGVLMRSRFVNFSLVWSVILTPLYPRLHGAATVSLNPRDDVFVPAMPTEARQP